MGFKLAHRAECETVGNWQLLAAIDALSSNDRTGANYHFSWFKALSQPTSAGAI